MTGPGVVAPMKVLLTTFAARTHLNLLIPTAWALRAAGHSVRVATHPDLLPVVVEAGLVGVPVGRPLVLPAIVDGLRRRSEGQSSAALGAEDCTDWHGVRRALFAYGQHVSGVIADDVMLADLVEVVGSWRPDLVVWDAVTYPGAMAAAVHHVPHVRSSFGIDRIGHLRARFRALRPSSSDPERDDPMRLWLGRRLQRYGAPFTEDLVTGWHTIDPVPPWLQVSTEVSTTAFQAVPYNGGSAVPGWLRERPTRPRVCLTSGVYGRESGLDVLLRPADLVRAVAGPDLEVVATLSDADRAALDPLPPHVRVADFVPMDVLLPTCAAVVHHLGMGTTLTALRAGTPQIRISDGTDMWGEEHLSATMVARGELVDLPTDRLDAAALRGAVRDAVEDPVRARAAERARCQLLTLPTPDHLVAILRSIAERGEPPT